MHGRFCDYFKNGTLKAKGEFSNGKKVGKFCWFFENGSKNMNIKMESNMESIVNIELMEQSRRRANTKMGIQYH